VRFSPVGTRVAPQRAVALGCAILAFGMVILVAALQFSSLAGLIAAEGFAARALVLRTSWPWPAWPRSCGNALAGNHNCVRAQRFPR